MTQPPCDCGERARDLLTALGWDPDRYTTPTLTGSGRDSHGTCEHGVTWYARPRPRAAEYKRLRAAGVSPDAAAVLAQNQPKPR